MGGWCPQILLCVRRSPANYTIALDLVIFADGSMFGPKQSRESDEVLGMFLGTDTANPTGRGTFKPKQAQ